MGNMVNNISVTVAVLGLAFSVTGNSSLDVSPDYLFPQYELYDYVPKNNENGSIFVNNENSIYMDDRKGSRLMQLAEESFGEMRDATKDEIIGINKYIKSISKPTGVDFFSSC